MIGLGIAYAALVILVGILDSRRRPAPVQVNNDQE